MQIKKPIACNGETEFDCESWTDMDKLYFLFS